MTLLPVWKHRSDVGVTMAKYSLDELKRKLGASGWRSVAAAADKTDAPEGTLGDMAKAAHARQAEGHSPGYLKEIETEIEVDALQLQALWHHMGLPVL
jgi:hypothetical protein